MKRMWLLALLVLLSGCSRPVWETVDDEQPLAAAASWPETAYEIAIGLPEGMQKLEETEKSQLYGSEQLEVETSRFLTASLDSAVRTVSGYEAEELTILKTSRFGLPEYQFAWVCQTDQGSRLYRADLILDDVNCYAIVCSRPEAAGGTLDSEIRQVFSTIGLFSEEGI